MTNKTHIPSNTNSDETYRELGAGAPGQPSAHRGGEWGDMIVSFVRYPAGFDAASMLRGFPDGYCPCPHWGYVLSGKFVVRYADREETFKRGDAYHMPPGHTPLYIEDTEVFEVSPAAELHHVIEVITACSIDEHHMKSD
jgi:hypothetical protein